MTFILLGMLGIICLLFVMQRLEGKIRRYDRRMPQRERRHVLRQMAVARRKKSEAEEFWSDPCWTDPEDDFNRVVR